MNFRSVILVFLILTAYIYGEESEKFSLSSCDVMFKLPGGFKVYDLGKDSMLSISNDKTQLTFLCNSNPERTSKILKLKTDYKDTSEVIELNRGFETILFKQKRIIKGRKIESIEAYIASRDREYRAALFREGELTDNDIQTMKVFLGSIVFDDHVNPAITEEDYEFRLNVVKLLVLILIGAILFFTLRIIIKKVNKPDAIEQESENENESSNV